MDAIRAEAEARIKAELGFDPFTRVLTKSEFLAVAKLAVKEAAKLPAMIDNLFKPAHA